MGDPNDSNREREHDREDEDTDPSHDVDEVSDESFPSSDPPSTWSSAGKSDT